MKKAMISIACALGLVCMGSNAGALVIGDDSYVGSINDGIPASSQNISHHHDRVRAVPDGGVTLVLLSGALVGIEALRRRFSA